MTEQAKEVATTRKKGAVQRAPTRVATPFDEMERLFESFLPRGWLRPARWEWPEWSELAAPFEGRAPKVDVVERDEDILVKAELPGVDKKDLDVSVTDNTLTIRATTREETEKEEGEYHRREIVSGAFARSILLPAEVDGDQARASFKDGLLEITIPKVTKARRRRIEVS